MKRVGEVLALLGPTSVLRRFDELCFRDRFIEPCAVRACFAKQNVEGFVADGVHVHRLLISCTVYKLAIVPPAPVPQGDVCSLSCSRGHAQNGVTTCAPISPHILVVPCRHLLFDLDGDAHRQRLPACPRSAEASDVSGMRLSVWRDHLRIGMERWSA